MSVQDQLAALIFFTLLNVFIHPYYSSSIVFIASVSLTGLIAFITKKEDKQVEELRTEVNALKEKMSSISLSMGMRK